jgi:two-component system response regulator AtoC
MARILLVEDDQNALDGLAHILQDEGYAVKAVDDGETALQEIKQDEYDMLLTDLKLPGIDGLELYREVKGISPDIAAIVVTAFGTVRTAVVAMKEGVYDYITKPIEVDELLIIIKNALNRQELLRENIMLRDQVQKAYSFENIIGKSGPMMDVFKKVTKVSSSNSTVLVRGESGTGKELIAKAIHFNSQRKESPLVTIDCASLPENLLESELFGYEKGAFTGAFRTKMGRFEIAHGGTLFLDEIGDITPGVQAKLLRALEERTIIRLGGTKEMPIDVRVIASTNKNLENALKEGMFREDLYYRLNVIPIFLPPLRDRREDIPLLVQYFVNLYSEETHIPPKKISKEVIDICLNYEWLGNVRELEHAIENAVVMGDGDMVLPEHLPFNIFSGVSRRGEVVKTGDTNGSYNEQMDIAEKMIIQDALRKMEGNRTKAAKLLGISLRTMRYKVKKYKL